MDHSQISPVKDNAEDYSSKDLEPQWIRKLSTSSSSPGEEDLVKGDIKHRHRREKPEARNSSHDTADLTKEEFSVDVVPKNAGSLQVMHAAEMPTLEVRRDGGSTPDQGKDRNVMKASKQAVANVLSNTVEKLRKLLGFTPDCFNGGTKNSRGDCVCMKYFKGNLCEEIVCVNNGTKHQVPNTTPIQYVCKCPHPEYISGTHCEIVKCMNGGRPVDNGHCRCLDYWYTGQFCESYTASWGAVLGVPLACIVIIIICCVVCRLDLCPRKHPRPRRQRRAAPPSSTLATVPSTTRDFWPRSLRSRESCSRRGQESSLRLQENLLNEEIRSLPPLGASANANVASSYVIRLDTIPAFNPRMIGIAEEHNLKPIEPPPPYEQVIASGNPSGGGASGRSQRPPDYTPQVRPPPPPRFRPPSAPPEE